MQIVNNQHLIREGAPGLWSADCKSDQQIKNGTGRMVAKTILCRLLGSRKLERINRNAEFFFNREVNSQ